MAHKDLFTKKGRPKRTVISENPMFGEPTLFSQGNGAADWARAERTSVLSTDQKSTTGWLAKLYGGNQVGWGSAGSLYIPVNEMPLGELLSAQWTYWMANTELFGCQIQIWVHDPDDNTRRADIIQSGTATLLSNDAGWNGHILNRTTDLQFFWFGEDDASTLTGSDLTSASTSRFSLATFQSDVLFKNWTIYRISLSNGFYNAGHFGDMYVADVKINGEVIQLKPTVEEQLEAMRDDQAKALTTIPTWTFGAPVLKTGGNGLAGWIKDVSNVESLFQKSPSGIVANLYGGLQTGGQNWAAVYVPVNDMPITEFNSAQWTYRLAAAQIYGHNIVIWLHDPADLGNRVEVTQGGSVGGLGHADAWNDHTLDVNNKQFFYYGEGVSTDISAGDLHTWAEFQADVTFTTWEIYRISIEYGWFTSTTFGESWLTDLKLNGQIILLQPGPGEIMGRETKSFYLVTSGDPQTDVPLVTPGGGRRIKVLSLNMITANVNPTDFECYFSVADTMPATKVIAIRNLATGAVIEHFVNFGDNGPVGLVGEQVTMRTSTNIGGDGIYTIVYREV